MRLEVLHVPDCPNLLPLLERLAQVTDLPVVTRVIETDADATQFGMAGSPTLLVDGVEPFAAAGECECGVSCRLYRDDDGRIVPAPSVEQLRVAIGEDAVAYPFSAVPARRRVRIGDQVDVYTMCAVDALGIAPMLRRDTVIGTSPTAIQSAW
jgi:alkylmercury lyase-like protein